MSKYTVELKQICESYSGYYKNQSMTTTEVIIGSIPKLFEDVVLYDPTYKDVLFAKIIKHYYFREIGSDNVSKWIFWLQRKMNEILPYYNQLYKSATLEFNPFYDVDLKKTGQKLSDVQGDIVKDNTLTNESDTMGSSEAQNNVLNTTTKTVDVEDTGTSGSGTFDVYSDTPQGALTNVINNSYLTNARKVDVDGDFENNGHSSESGTDTSSVVSEVNSNNKTTGFSAGNEVENKKIKTTDTYLEEIKGKQGGEDYSTLLLKYRETFINIDMLIIKDLETLFFNLW